ncbi:MAG: hypothetical protein QXH37_00320 [Candidatus Bathyarchaeia archaeon]
MKTTHVIILLALLIVSSVVASAVYIQYFACFDDAGFVGGEVFFGVTFSKGTPSDAKRLIDRVKNYTNLLVITAWNELCAQNDNGTALSEVCEYAVNAKLHFIVFFSFISQVTFEWHRGWLETAKERFGEYFLGVYFYDEPGGKLIDTGKWRGTVLNASSYSEAAEWYVNSISSSPSMRILKYTGITVFTADYALYWFDYLAGYDCIFVEFGWNHSRTQHIALGRGAANVQGKDWGVIITWTFNHPPYLENGTRLYEDLVTAYKAGAKYIVVFNYPRIDGNPYGILTEEHFKAMEDFWNLINSPKPSVEKVRGQVAYVLPKDYGWGMRGPDDKIWGIWPPDNRSPIIWENMNKLIEKYGLKLDIIYDDSRFNFKKKYAIIYFWNSTVS